MSNFFVAGAAAMTSSRDDWETPQALFEELDSVYHFTLDPCSTHENAKCARHFTKEEDGLSRSWAGEVVFVNPPYGRGMADWARKCPEEAGGAIIVGLFPARTDTRWFHDHIYGIAQIEFLKGRLKFEQNGIPSSPAPFPSMLVRWGNG